MLISENLSVGATGLYLFVLVIQIPKKEMANQRTQILSIPDQSSIELESARYSKTNEKKEKNEKNTRNSSLNLLLCINKKCRGSNFTYSTL